MTIVTCGCRSTGRVRHVRALAGGNPNRVQVLFGTTPNPPVQVPEFSAHHPAGAIRQNHSTFEGAVAREPDMSRRGTERLWTGMAMGIATALILSGCAGVRPDPAPRPAASAPATPAPKPTAQAKATASPATKTKPAKPRRQAGQAPDQPAAPPIPAPETAAPVPPLLPVGMDEGSLTRALGPPASSREETPARVLSFRRRECALNLTLYPDVETRVFRALSYEVTSDDQDERAVRVCAARFGIAGDDGPGVAARK